MTAVSAFQVDVPKYEILGEVGHGGMATVYRARDRRLGREVALKVIHRHLRENPEVGRRFRSEALAVAKVKHPNIVEVYDVSSDEESERYLVVEFVSGVTLRQLLSENGPLPAEVAASIGVEIARALAHAHRHGVIHRDIKPENVLLSLSEVEPTSGTGAPVRVKLTDFGIAKLLDAQGVTCTGQVLGSPAHMAPEQIEGGDVDARSDVFGLGVLLYELFSGALPFEGKNPAQVLRRVLDGTFLPPERVLPTIGARYGAIIQKALAHSPQDRYASATELGDALEAELVALEVRSPREELNRFLSDRALYESESVERIVSRLAAIGAEARKRGDVVLSAASFNRALAYRPDDTGLLAAVTGIRRRSRTRKLTQRLLVAAGFLALLGGAAYAGRLYRSRGVVVSGANREESPARPAAVVAPAPAVSAPAPSEPPQAPVRIVPNGQRKTPITKPPRQVEPGTRIVRTPVVGPQNARVRIDGRLLPWFNNHELSFGTHVFEFVPPNEDCCEAPPAQTVDVIAGEGPQLVRGVIQFRPATVELVGAKGSRASCGMVGGLEAGVPRRVALNRAELPISCTVFAPSGSAAGPKVVTGELRPGQRFTVSGF